MDLAEQLEKRWLDPRRHIRGFAVQSGGPHSFDVKLVFFDYSEFMDHSGQHWYKLLVELPGGLYGWINMKKEDVFRDSVSIQTAIKHYDKLQELKPKPLMERDHNNKYRELSIAEMTDRVLDLVAIKDNSKKIKSISIVVTFQNTSCITMNQKLVGEEIMKSAINEELKLIRAELDYRLTVLKSEDVSKLVIESNLNHQFLKKE